MPESNPIPVAAAGSRARNAKREATNWSGTVKETMTSATLSPSEVAGAMLDTCSK
jgi:hypothetical protein